MTAADRRGLVGGWLGRVLLAALLAGGVLLVAGLIVAPPPAVDVVRAGQSAVYHRPGCRMIARSRQLTTYPSAADARAHGLRPCRICGGGE